MRCQNTFWVIILLFCSVIAVPNIGITFDYYPIEKHQENPRTISFSGHITFKDKTVPGDKEKMTDRKLANLARIAHREMADLCITHFKFKLNACPLTMAAMQIKESIYFASSFKNWDGDVIADQLHKQDGGPGELLGRVAGSVYNHANKGCCAELNILYFFNTQNAEDSDKETVWRGPPPEGARIAVWRRGKGDNLDTGNVMPPCGEPGEGGPKYGCNAVVPEYRLHPIVDVEPDGSEEDNWDFEKVRNRRHLSMDRCST